MMSAKNNRLVGMKAIADYLDTSERNIYLREKEFGLPLQRVAGSKGYSVYIYISDLEKWLKQRESFPIQDKKNARKIIARIALIIIPLIIVVVVFFIIGKAAENQLPDVHLAVFSWRLPSWILYPLSMRRARSIECVTVTKAVPSSLFTLTRS